MAPIPRFRLTRKIQFLGYVLDTWESDPGLSWEALWELTEAVQPGVTGTVHEGGDLKVLVFGEYKIWYTGRHSEHGDSRVGHGRGSEYYELMKKWHKHVARRSEYKKWRSQRLNEWHAEQSGGGASVGDISPFSQDGDEPSIVHRLHSLGSATPTVYGSPSHHIVNGDSTSQSTARDSLRDMEIDRERGAIGSEYPSHSHNGRSLENRPDTDDVITASPREPEEDITKNQHSAAHDEAEQGTASRHDASEGATGSDNVEGAGNVDLNQHDAAEDEEDDEEDYEEQYEEEEEESSGDASVSVIDDHSANASVPGSVGSIADRANSSCSSIDSQDRVTSSQAQTINDRVGPSVDAAADSDCTPDVTDEDDGSPEDAGDTISDTNGTSSISHDRISKRARSVSSSYAPSTELAYVGTRARGDDRPPKRQRCTTEVSHPPIKKEQLEQLDDLNGVDVDAEAEDRSLADCSGYDAEEDLSGHAQEDVAERHVEDWTARGSTAEARQQIIDEHGPISNTPSAVATHQSSVRPTAGRKISSPPLLQTQRDRSDSISYSPQPSPPPIPEEVDSKAQSPTQARNEALMSAALSDALANDPTIINLQAVLTPSKPSVADCEAELPQLMRCVVFQAGKAALASPGASLRFLDNLATICRQAPAAGLSMKIFDGLSM